NGRNHLFGGSHRCGHGDTLALWPSLGASAMTTEATSITARPVLGSVDRPWTLQWSPIVAGALTATALSSILITFAATVGLGVSSSAPTWRDASVALWLLSGIYLILQALVSFG